MRGLFEKNPLRRLNQVQYIAVGFILVILAGTFLLMLPVSSRDGEGTGFLDALFTAVSSACVTGLVVQDTFTHWTVFGQLVILGLIQIGGLGFVTIAVGFSMLFRKRIGLRQRDLMKESINAMEIGGIVRFASKIWKGTALFEAIGAVLLSIRFVPDFGWARGIYYGIFHSVSAFCNAGFDLMGSREPYSSFTTYAADPLVNLVLMLLIVTGGIGFVVWKDVSEKKWRIKRYSLHTKLVLTVTAVLILGGAVLLLIFERDHTLAGMSWQERILVSLFGSVTARTAGFNTVDTGALLPESKLLTILLMFIGGSPGSTAGGIKTTTIAVLLICVYSRLRNESGCNVYKRRISDAIIKKASVVFLLNLAMGMVSTIVILASSNLPLEDVLFEVFSAIGTAGMTTGVTRDLNFLGKIVVILLMYCGRIGSMTFALSFMQRPDTGNVTLPAEKITIG